MQSYDIGGVQKKCNFFSILQLYLYKENLTLKTPYRCGSDIWVVVRLCCRS